MPQRTRLMVKTVLVQFVPGLDQLVNQSSGGGEAHGQSPLTRSQTETEGDMGLAGLML